MVSPTAQQQMYGSGVASLIGGCGISLDGQSVQIPDDTGSYIQDDISSINESSYYRGSGGMKIVGTASSMEEGNAAGTSGMKTTAPELGDIQRSLSSETPVPEKGEPPKKSPNTSKTASARGTRNNGKQSGCLPTWVLAAPKWLKCVIVVSIAMLVGAMVLVAVALSSALMAENEKSNNSATSEQVPTDMVVVGTPPVPSPAPTRRNTDEPSAASVIEEDWTGKPAEEVTQVEETKAPVEEETDTVPYDEFVTTFFVTGGRFTNDALVQLPGQLKTLPVRGGTSFMVHLGDWNSPYATQCDKQSYQDVDDLFSNSSIPVYFVPGDNDFNGKCTHKKI